MCTNQQSCREVRNDFFFFIILELPVEGQQQPGVAEEGRREVESELARDSVDIVLVYVRFQQKIDRASHGAERAQKEGLPAQRRHLFLDPSPDGRGPLAVGEFMNKYLDKIIKMYVLVFKSTSLGGKYA